MPVPERRRRYSQAALRREAERVARAAAGTRNHTLNLAAYHLGRPVGAGELIREEADRVLHAAAVASGLVTDDGPAPARRTIASGLESGAGNPRSPAQRTARRIRP